MSRVPAFPDPHSLARDELTSLLQELTSREEVVSNERRVLHAQIGALRQEFVDRLRDEGNVVISGSDLLDPGSAGVCEQRNPSPQNASDGIALPEAPAPDVGPDAPLPRDPSTG
jgi:RsiG-like